MMLAKGWNFALLTLHFEFCTLHYFLGFIVVIIGLALQLCLEGFEFV